jgi:hypothetical protein
MMGSTCADQTAAGGEIDIMNSTGTEPGIESELIDLDGVPFAKMGELGSETLRQSMHRVVERTRHLRAPYRSNNAAAGERVD